MATQLASVARAVADAPVVAPALDLLSHRTTIVMIVGIALLLAMPFFPGMTPERLTLLTNVVMVAAGFLGVRFSVEGIMQTRADLAKVVEDVSMNTSSASMTTSSTSTSTSSAPPPEALGA